MNEDLFERQLAVIMARFSEFEKRSEKQLSNHEKRLNDLEKTNKDVTGGGKLLIQRITY
jgi:hypothetical protein